MSTSPVTWSRLRIAAIAIYPKAAIGLALIYVVYYLKKGGFETAPLEVTLLGCLLALVTVATIHILCPEVIAKFSTDNDYEEHVQMKVERKFVNASFWLPELRDEPTNLVETKCLDYKFDEKFELSNENLRLALGDIGVISFAARLRFLRKNHSLAPLRWILALSGISSLFLMYSRPLLMLFSIYGIH